MPESVITVGLADDDAFVRRALTTLLAPNLGVSVSWAVSDGSQAVAAANESPVDAVLLDLQMPVMDGLTALAELGNRWPSLPVVMLTTFDAAERMHAALTAGARGYFVKDDDPELIAAGLRNVAAGGFAFSPSASATLVAGFLSGRSAAATSTSRGGIDPRVDLLTARETEVLGLLAQSLSNKQIAQRLTVSEATVKTHVSVIIAKLGVPDRVGAAVWAYRNGIL